MLNFDKITEKMDKVKQNYYKTNKEINNKIEELEQKKENGEIAPNDYEEKVESYENTRNAEIESYKEQLNKVYNKAEDKLKEQVGFGEGDPAATSGVLNNIDTLSKTERKIIADKWKNSGNYIGLKALREKDIIAAGDFQDIEEQKEKLNKKYQAKLSVLDSGGKYSSNMERMRKLANL